MSYIPAGLWPLATSVFDVVGDGHYGFRCVSHSFIGGDQHQYVAMRQELMDHVHVYWGRWYHKVYEGELDTVLTRLGWLWNTPCERPWWLWNLDLFGFATKHNWTYVVFGMGGRGIPYGETFLPMKIGDTPEPGGVTFLVCTGDHWVRLYLDVHDGVLPIPPVSQMWRYWADDSAKAAWLGTLYRRENLTYQMLVQSAQ